MEIKTLEVKNISHYARGSEETPCFNATVYINGKRAVEVSNNGHGGMDRQDVWHENGFNLKEINEWCVKTFGKKSFTYQSDSKEKECFYDMDLEHVCHDALYNWLDAKTLKKDLNSKFLFMEKNSKELNAYKKAKGEDEELFASFFRGKHEGGTCLNFIPFDDALKLYKESA
tara:strand:- start:3 stop:518 length:516 start_codon:yes stop_codon:yes gene_type:complete